MVCDPSDRWILIMVYDPSDYWILIFVYDPFDDAEFGFLIFSWDFCNYIHQRYGLVFGVGAVFVH